MLKELESERLGLIDEIQKIEIQLKDPNRIDPETNTRLTGYEYFEWKQRAESARRIKLARLREVNGEIKLEKENVQAVEFAAIHEKLDKIIDYLEEEVE